MQKPKFKTTEKAAWVFIHTKLHPHAKTTMDRRTAARCGYFMTAARKLNRSEKEMPLPFMGETIAKYVTRAIETSRAGR